MKITTSVKNILEVNLDKKTFQIKKRNDLQDFLGGVGLSMKLYSEFRDEKPLIFSIGPLNGFFPYASKTSVFFGIKDKVYDYYIGGSLSSRMRFADLDAIVFLGRSKNEIFLDIQGHHVNFLDYGIDFDSQGLPGRRSFIRFSTNKYLLDYFFRFTGNEADAMLVYKKISGLVISATHNFTIQDFSDYQEKYQDLLLRHGELNVQKDNFLSCSGCPMGCSKSVIGEKGGSLLAHSLVACSYSQKIFNNTDLVISLLGVLGYSYTHEDLERYLENLRQLKNEFSFS
jgi:aldehyde:ferredoxin oxidoreductase